MDNYYDIVQRLGRVKVDATRAVSLDVAADIATRTRWLRHTAIPELDRALGVTFPFVVVHRAVWFQTLPDGTGGIVRAHVGPFALADEQWIWAVALSAVTLLEYPDELLRGVLAHEFLHYVWSSLAVVTQGDGALDVTAEYSVLVDYLARDTHRATAAAVWLSPDLQSLLTRAEGHGPEVDAIQQRIAATWLTRVPVVRYDGQYRVDGTWVIDPALVAKAGLDGRRSAEASARAPGINA